MHVDSLPICLQFKLLWKQNCKSPPHTPSSSSKPTFPRQLLGLSIQPLDRQDPQGLKHPGRHSSFSFTLHAQALPSLFGMYEILSRLQFRRYPLHCWCFISKTLSFQIFRLLSRMCIYFPWNVGDISSYQHIGHLFITHNAQWACRLAWESKKENEQCYHSSQLATFLVSVFSCVDLRTMSVSCRFPQLPHRSLFLSYSVWLKQRIR